ncbi:ATP-binding protein [Roseibacterium sp. SDUM158016]|uniref:hybrid sensor histidine kinase/response regulator n=1 Tax=Roseicyclus sediminis TaxID=2980997 RepID=UPI0021CEC987|nr:ATP-binding protein [Roseibacterium sp. SDUM158016]MCU4651205.1 ATP-binding protein [Roseibacterium sp. SDUM158016]
MSLIGLAHGAWRFEQNLEAVREAEGDNRAWNVSQLEVDYQDFLIALQDARDAFQRGDPLRVRQADTAMRLEFDIFYSRITAFTATLRRSEFEDEFRDRLDRLLTFRDLTADAVDAIEAGDRTALGELYSDVAAFEVGIRELTVGALQALVSRAEVARLEEQRLLRSFLRQSVLLLVLTLVSASLALRLVGLIRRQAEETLQAQALVNKAFEGAQEGVLVCDADGRILLSNPTAREIFGYGPGELEGKLLAETVVPPSRMRRYRMGMAEVLAQVRAGESGGLGPIQFEGLRSDGEVFKASVALRAEAASDEALRIFVFVRDITERFEFEERLRVALHEAREHSDAKGRFLATMSHEMRTPLHGVVASLDLLRNDELDPETSSLLATARSCSERALAQIDYALDAIRSEGDSEAPAPFDPVAAVRSIIAEMEPLARIKGNVISLDLQDLGDRTTIAGQPKAYARTVFNLVGNAVKFTSGGRITIRLEDLPGRGAEPRELLTEVRDTGPGIERKDWEKIFDPFEQSEATHQATANPGFGLGLSIVKQDVARMRGRIEVDSVVGQGACFRFTVPFVEVDAPLSPQADRRVAEAVIPGQLPRQPMYSHALVVDDNAVNCALVARMLEQLGVAAQCCVSGAEAVEMARTRPYGLILMDVRMPGMDGVEATELIRRGGASRNAVIIGITAQVDFMSSEAYRGSGMTSVLIKPFGKHELARHIGEHRAAGNEEVAVPDMSDEARHRVLVALRDALDLIGDKVGFALASDVCVGARAAIAAACTEDPTTADKAHSAGGSALMMGLSDLGRMLQDLERMADAAEPTDSEALRMLLSSLTLEVHTVEEVLRDLPRDGTGGQPDASDDAKSISAASD